MEFYVSLVIVAAILIVGIRVPGVLIGGTLFTYQLGAVTHLSWIGTGYIIAATLITVTRYAYRPHKIILQPADFGVFAIVGLSTVSVYWSFDPDASVTEALALTLSVGGMYSIARLIRQDDGKWIYAMLWTIVIVSPILSVLLLGMRDTSGWTAQQRLLIEDSEASAVGISQPFASCLLACSILLLSRVPNWQKGLIILALAVISYAAIASGTRSVFLAYGAGLLVYFALSLRSIKLSQLWQGVVALAVASSFLMYFAPIEQLSDSIGRLFGDSRGVGTDISSLERLAAWRTAWELFQQYPLAGMGDGAIGRYAAYPYPHNLELEVLVEFGVLGAAVFGLWIVAVVREAWFVKACDAKTGAVLIAFVAVVMMQHQVSYSFAMARMLFLMVALLAAVGSQYRAMPQYRRGTREMRAKRGHKSGRAQKLRQNRSPYRSGQRAVRT